MSHTIIRQAEIIRTAAVLCCFVVYLTWTTIWLLRLAMAEGVFDSKGLSEKRAEEKPRLRDLVRVFFAPFMLVIALGFSCAICWLRDIILEFKMNNRKHQTEAEGSIDVDPGTINVGYASGTKTMKKNELKKLD